MNQPRLEGVQGAPAPFVHPRSLNAAASSGQQDTPPEIAQRIKRGRRLKYLAVFPLVLSLMAVLGFTAAMWIRQDANAWYEEREEATTRWEYYKECQAGKRTGEYYCGKPGAPKPKPPPSPKDAPFSTSIEWSDLRAVALGLVALAVVGLVAAIGVYLFGKSRQDQARREDPTRVVIGHSRALEILVWLVVPLTSAILLGLGLLGPRSNRVFVPIALLLVVFPFLFQLLLYAFRPSEADATGLRLGFGRKLLWRDYQGKTDVALRRRDPIASSNTVIGHYYRLQFRNGPVNLYPLSTSNWERLREFFNRGVGRPVI